jgi:hypothetical protein
MSAPVIIREATQALRTWKRAILATAPIVSGKELGSTLLDLLDEVHAAYPVRRPRHVGYGTLARRYLSFYGAMIYCTSALSARTDSEGREGRRGAIYYGAWLALILPHDFLPGGPPRERPALRWLTSERKQCAGWMATLIRDHRKARARRPVANATPPAWLAQFAAPLRMWLTDGIG